MLTQGDRFLAYESSVGGRTMFWVDTLSFQMSGKFNKGDVIELQQFALESNKITFLVHTVDKKTLDVPVTDVVVPVSAVGLDKTISIDESENIVHHITDLKNNNRIFLILLKVPSISEKKVRIPLGDTDNILEYTVYPMKKEEG